MAAWSDTAENKLVDWFFRGQALGLANSSAGAGSGPTSLYVALVTTVDTDAAAGTEVSAVGYARVAVASSMANWSGTQGAGTTVASSGTSGTISNNNAVTFGSPTANWGTVDGAELWDSLSGGTRVAYGALGTNKTINNGDAAPSFAAGALTFQWDN